MVLEEEEVPMREQDDTIIPTKQRRNRQTSKQSSTQPPAPEPPTNDDKEAWKQYWAAIQPKEWFEAWGYWRTEPEIDAARKAYLTKRRAIQPNIGKGIYPFKDVVLSRADIEWLLATHDDGRGPVNWKTELSSGRKGLDLRGAIIGKIDYRIASVGGMPLVYS